MDKNIDHLTRPTDADLERHKKNARSRKRIAWDALKMTRNPQYVSIRYGFPLADLEKALEKIPLESGTFVRSDSARDAYTALKRARDVLPEITRDKKPGADDD